MAAGEGRRLRPLTERWPKPVLPIDGRAVVATLVEQLRHEGFGQVTVVVGHLGDQVERLLEGLPVRFARQPAADGSADAVLEALESGTGLPALATAADTVFAAGDLARFRDEFDAADASGAVAYVRRPSGSAIRVEDGFVRTVVEQRPGELSPAPLWGLSEAIDLRGLPGPPYELAAAFQRAIDAGQPVAAVEIGATRQLTDPFDLVRENFPYLGDG